MARAAGGGERAVVAGHPARCGEQCGQRPPAFVLAAGHGAERRLHALCLAACPHTGAACFHLMAISTMLNAACPALIREDGHVTPCQELQPAADESGACLLFH